MLHYFQLEMVGMRWLNPGNYLGRLEAIYSDDCQRSAGFKALLYYDAYMAIIEADAMETLSLTTLMGFAGFLMSEFDMSPAEREDILSTVADFLLMNGFFSKSEIGIVVNLNPEVALETYGRMQPSLDVLDYYHSIFRTAEGTPIWVDFVDLDELLDALSIENIRLMLTPYIMRRRSYEADTDARLITSIIRGLCSSRPNISFKEICLGAEESLKFVRDLRLASDHQMARAGYGSEEIDMNRKFLLRVLINFFVPNGLIHNSDYESVL